MAVGRITRFLCLCVVLSIVGAGATAQQTVYKWVDENGVVHFSESPPEGVHADRLEIIPAPQTAPAAQSPAAPAPQAPVATPATPSPPASPAAAETPAAEISLEELDRRCDAAREKKIAPLREAEIESCKLEPRNDPEWCERHNADFGEGGRTITGAVRPRIFDDLPECVEALQERNRRGR